MYLKRARHLRAMSDHIISVPTGSIRIERFKGPPAFGKAFYVVDTIGFPLELLLLELRDQGCVVAWDQFISDALDHGWTFKTIKTRIIGSVTEAFGEGYAAEFGPRLNRFFTKGNNPCLT